MSRRAQFAVRKQGTVASGSWSTRTLTIDTDTCTVTVSRHNHPNNVLYHSLEVKVVQMWPRFRPDMLDDDYQSLKAKMTLRIVGKEVPVPYFSADDAAVVNTSSLSTPSRSAGGNPDSVLSNSADFAFIAGDTSKKSRPLQIQDGDELYEVWMLRFTSIESYEAAVTLLGCLKNPDGSTKKVYGDHVAVDMTAVKSAWAARHATNNAVATQLVGTLSNRQSNAAAAI